MKNRGRDALWAGVLLALGAAVSSTALWCDSGLGIESAVSKGEITTAGEKHRESGIAQARIQSTERRGAHRTVATPAAALPSATTPAGRILRPVKLEALGAEATARLRKGKRWFRDREPVTVDLERVRAARDGTGPRLRFDLGNGRKVVGKTANRVIRGENSYTLHGKLRGELGGRFVLTVHDAVVVANIRSEREGYWQVRYLGEGVHEVRAFDESRAPRCALSDGHMQPARARAPEEQFESAAAMGAAADGVEFASDGASPPVEPPPEGNVPPTNSGGGQTGFDVLIVYTPTVTNLVGGEAAIGALAHMAVDETNICYANSGVQLYGRLVHHQEMDDLESASMPYDLGRFSGEIDGFMDEVHALRDYYYADIVSLWGDYSDYCGIAHLLEDPAEDFEDSAFHVCDYSCATGNLTFAHEMGHNMGSHHAVGDNGNEPGDGAYDYSNGWRWTGSDGKLYRSIMAHWPGNRVPCYSNPEVLYMGMPTGSPMEAPNAADNARSLNNLSSLVAGWRVIPDAALAAGPGALERLALEGETLPVEAVSVRNIGEGAVSYSVAHDCAWLSVSPGSGTAEHPVESPHAFSVQTESLSAGTYRDVVSFIGSAGAPVEIPVVIRILDGDATQIVEYQSAGPLTIGPGEWGIGPAAPYPSTIDVQGVDGTIADITVKIDGLSHDRSRDVDILLKGPQGQSVILVSDAGGDYQVQGVDLEFVTSLRGVAGALAPFDPLVSGTYSATDHFAGDIFDAPAPAAATEAGLEAFVGTDPNGAWELFVMDDDAINAGTIMSWRLEFVISLGATSYASWAQLYFGGETAPGGAPGDDPDGDAIPNLQEYALDLDPHANSCGALPRLVRGVPAGGEEPHAGLVVHRGSNHPDVNYRVEISSDLQTWFSGGTDTVVEADSPTFLKVYDAQEAGAQSARYLRLCVEQSGP